MTDLARDQVVRDRPISFCGVAADEAAEILLPQSNAVVDVDDDVAVEDVVDVWKHPEMCRLSFPFPANQNETIEIE